MATDHANNHIGSSFLVHRVFFCSSVTHYVSMKLPTLLGIAFPNKISIHPSLKKKNKKPNLLLQNVCTGCAKHYILFYASMKKERNEESPTTVVWIFLRLSGKTEMMW